MRHIDRRYKGQRDHERSPPCRLDPDRTAGPLDKHSRRPKRHHDAFVAIEAGGKRVPQLLLDCPGYPGMRDPHGRTSVHGRHFDVHSAARTCDGVLGVQQQVEQRLFQVLAACHHQDRALGRHRQRVAGPTDGTFAQRHTAGGDLTQVHRCWRLGDPSRKGKHSFKGPVRAGGLARHPGKHIGHRFSGTGSPLEQLDRTHDDLQRVVDRVHSARQQPRHNHRPIKCKQCLNVQIRRVGHRATLSRSRLVFERLEDSWFEAVILDLAVPGNMRSDELLLHLHRLGGNVCGIVMRGCVNDILLVRYHDHGFDRVLPKLSTLTLLARTLGPRGDTGLLAAPNPFLRFCRPAATGCKLRRSPSRVPLTSGRMTRPLGGYL